MNFKISVDDSATLPLSDDENADGIITPKNIGPNTVYILHVPQGDAPTAGDVVALGTPFAVGEQIQIGSGQSTRNLTKYFAACDTGQTAQIRGIY